MNRKRWQIAPCDKNLARELAQECEIDALVALILVSRGVSDPFEVEEFLSDDQQLGDPFEFIDMDKAVDRIHSALDNGERICVYGDYDADGVTSTAMLFTYLSSKGADVIYMVPERAEGYGLHNAAVDRMKEQNVKLMITVDNGITAVDEVEYAVQRGIDVVVTDHHLPQSELPNACAVVDPHRDDCPSTFKEYAGAGVCFKLICALEGVPGEEMCGRYADLAAVGTIADVMKLTGENRIIVRRGIERLGVEHVGFSSIIDAAGLRKRALSASTVSYGIAPRLNAAGRVGSCLRAVNLLIENDAAQADALAAEINEANIQRQTMEREISAQAIELIEQNNIQYDRVLVVCGSNWHHGVIGIVASRICERYGRPAIVLADEDGTAVGSARSVGDFSLYDAISSCADLLDRFGGHAQAAGLSMNIGAVDEFRRRINEYARLHYDVMPFDTLCIDCKLKPTAFTPDMVHSLEVLAPFGTGNPVPMFGLFGMRIDRISPVSGGAHLRLEVSRDGASATVMRFNCTAQEFGFRQGDVIDIAVNADVNEYMGSEQVTLSAKAIRPSGVDEDALLTDIRRFEQLMRGESVDGACLTRDDVIKVYRAVSGGFSGDAEVLRLRAGCGYYAARAAVEALKELKIINCTTDGTALSITVNPVKEKMQLEASEIFRRAAKIG